MAIPTIKTTYALDVRTVKELEELAARWEVSKSEALRRVIHKAASRELDGKKSAVQVLEQLQQSMKLPERKADLWIQSVRSERKKSDPKRRGS